MIVENPQVTLEEDAYGFPEEAGEKAFIHWLSIIDVEGDDGKHYWIDCNIASYRSMATLSLVPFGATDMWAMAIRSEKGKVIQLPWSIYKLADFPQVATIAWHPYPHGALTIKRSENEVAVDLEDFHLVCKPDEKTWHFNFEDKERGIKAEWVHTGVGYPLWYGKEKPGVCTPHNIAYGYYWPGPVEGMLTIDGRKVRIKGKGVRERYSAVDLCIAEVGGWHEWMWFDFDEMSGCVWEMKFSKYKQSSLYLVDEEQFFQTDDFNVEHHDWAYLRSIGCFVPTLYKVTVETGAGILEMGANVVGCKSWAHSNEVPDIPFLIVDWDRLDGTFTYKDGRKRILTNGVGGTHNEQWKPYPSIFAPEISGMVP